MGLAIDGNVVHGIAKGGQAFLPITKNKDGSVVIDGHTYNDSLIGKRASGLSNSTQYYLTGAWDIGSRFYATTVNNCRFYFGKEKIYATFWRWR